MTVKRRDSKGRILRTGESQRPDGRYCFKYMDAKGKPQFLYAWRLEPTDRTPKGKRDGPALREKEKEVQRDQLDGIDHSGGNMTVLELYQKHIRLNAQVKPGTQGGPGEPYQKAGKRPSGLHANLQREIIGRQGVGFAAAGKGPCVSHDSDR